MITYNEDLSKHSTIGIGGKASVFITPKNLNELILAIRNINSNKVFILGNGSNTLFKDKGFSGTVIKIKDNFNKIEKHGNKIYVESGVMINDLIEKCIDHKLKDIECLAGIPGTVGGSIYMNAGFTKPISTLIEKVYCIDFKGKEYWFTNEECNFGHRTSMFQNKKYIIIGCVLKLTEGDCRLKHMEYLKLRKDTQPIQYKSLGSVFIKNNLKDCQGWSVGDAEVKASYIINKGKATAEDVLKLIRKINTNSKLEIEIVGD